MRNSVNNSNNLIYMENVRRVKSGRMLLGYNYNKEFTHFFLSLFFESSLSARQGSKSYVIAINETLELKLKDQIIHLFLWKYLLTSKKKKKECQQFWQ